MWRVVNGDGLYPYSFTPVQALQPTDYAARLQFCHWIMNNRNLLRNIIYTDESTFTERGILNRRNEHIWSDVNPNAVREHRSQYRFSDIVIRPFVLPQRLMQIRTLRFWKRDS